MSLIEELWETCKFKFNKSRIESNCISVRLKNNYFTVHLWSKAFFFNIGRVNFNELAVQLGTSAQRKVASDGKAWLSCLLRLHLWPQPVGQTSSARPCSLWNHDTAHFKWPPCPHPFQIRCTIKSYPKYVSINIKRTWTKNKQSFSYR